MAFAVIYSLIWVLCLSLFFADVSLPGTARDVIDAIPKPTVSTFSSICSFVLLTAFLSEILPGKKVQGTKLENGTSLVYKPNGLLVSGVTVLGLALASYSGAIDGSYIADHVFDLWASGSLFAIVLSLYLFISARYLGVQQGAHKSRSFIRDFVLGSELNPHLLGVNLKFFSYRPAMCGWLLVNLSFLLKQFQTLSFITNRMLAYQLVANFYIVDYFVYEDRMITTWDIIAENFGFMLVWADYCFIPMAFSVQNIFLYNNPEDISITSALSIVFLFLVGYTIFRGTNSQKHQFKLDASKPIWGKPPITVAGRLLASGYWGLARHINYLGDLVVALSLCLPCGLISGRAYFYFFYLLLLLLHRERRDEHRCDEKYGLMWKEYCKLVPYRILPFVY
mmetsp:Transcript_28333/g.111258  ORF Transcript_28333/g.111258 Transcript_28333/m.111258 type:complete len:394 (-) Transcript_28333:140-1321(-)